MEELEKTVANLHQRVIELELALRTRDALMQRVLDAINFAKLEKLPSWGEMVREEDE
jgi:hypothetical protein